MRAGRKRNQGRRGGVLALAAMLTWTAAAPVAASPFGGRVARPLEGPLPGVWEQVLGWLTAVWQAETDPPPDDPPPPPPPDKQGHTIDPDGG